jgi:predicted nucleic acid-binding protein
MAPELPVVHLKIRHRATGLTPPDVATQDLLEQAFVEVLDFPDQACLHYAETRADLKTLGTMIGANDLLIAAHARSLDLTLVTNNTREFSRVRSLAIENCAISP